MAAAKNTPEKQAQLSILLACIGLLAILGASGMLYKNFNGELKQFVYGESSRFLPALLGAFLLAGGCGLSGFALGFTSAGQKKHTKPQLSWIGFFMSAGVLALTFAVFAAFWVMKLPIAQPK